MVLLFLILLADGTGKLLAVWRKPAAERGPAVLNALIDFAAAACCGGSTVSGRAEHQSRALLGCWLAEILMDVDINLERAVESLRDDGLTLLDDPLRDVNSMRPHTPRL